MDRFIPAHEQAIRLVFSLNMSNSLAFFKSHSIANASQSEGRFCNILTEPFGCLEVKHKPSGVTEEAFDRVFAAIIVSSMNLDCLVRDVNSHLRCEKLCLKAVDNGNIRGRIDSGGRRFSQKNSFEAIKS